MTAKLEVFDADKLRAQLTQRKIRFVPHQSEYCWAYQLIARGARVISQVEAYGFVLLPEFRDWTLPELRDAIDREFSCCPRRTISAISRQGFCATHSAPDKPGMLLCREASLLLV